MDYKVSVIIPVYKVEKYLRRCLDSVVNQTLFDVEIILIDDGSPDGCPHIIDEYAQKDERVKVLHKQNEGLGMARNTGIEIATGELITAKIIEGTGNITIKFNATSEIAANIYKAILIG